MTDNAAVDHSGRHCFSSSLTPYPRRCVSHHIEACAFVSPLRTTTIDSYATRSLYPNHRVVGTVKQGVVLKLLFQFKHEHRVITCACNTCARLPRLLARSGWWGPRAFSWIPIAITQSASASSSLPCEPRAVMTDNQWWNRMVSALAPTLCIATTDGHRIPGLKYNWGILQRSLNAAALP